MNWYESPVVISRRHLLGTALGALVLPVEGLAKKLPQRVINYRPVNWPCRLLQEHREWCQVIREFEHDGIAKVLTVAPNTLATAIHDAAGVIPMGPGETNLGESRYGRLLRASSAPPYPLQNAGIRRADHKGTGIFLTVDLCPSNRPFEKRLFEDLLRHPLPRPIPVALALSGHWLQRHTADFEWLLKLEVDGQLAITFMNHTLTHFYDRQLATPRNFLLKEGTDFDHEVLGLEQLLIGMGIPPSIFFRFPGLVANESLVNRLSWLGLVPTGCDIWMTSGQRIRDGSIVLLHGNGNEPAGIDLFLGYLNRGAGKVTLSPLSEVIS